MTKSHIAISSCLLIANAVFAASVTPTYDTFGNLAGANFGGSGNPTDPVAITTIQDQQTTITLGLAAHQRYSNPPLANDGAGTYFALPGLNDGLVPGNPHSLGATWNFDYYIDVNTPTAVPAGSPYTFTLSYGTDASSLLPINPLNIGDNSPTPNFGGQNSQNLAFFAYGTFAQFQFNPLFPTFDANADADYSFVLEAFNPAGASIGKSAIVVRVGNGTPAPDGGATAVLLGSALAGISLVRRKIRG